ncbi:MAG: hypothetical protein AAF682_14350 [Planctomycetota bacterium]
MNRKPIFAALLTAHFAFPSLAHAMGGGSLPTFTVPIPLGTTSYTYKAYDYDPTIFDPDELLEEGTEKLKKPPQAGSSVTINFDDLYCEDGVVKGPAGSSGEGTAEVYVVLEFHQKHGSSTVTSKTMTIECEDLPQKGAAGDGGGGGAAGDG